MNTNTEPSLPTPGTDNFRMLEALIAAAPEPAWNLDSGLGIKANSRASVLRSLGWKVEHVQRARPGQGRRRDHGYRLLNPPTQRGAAA